LRLAFSTEVLRKVRQGSFRCRGEHWTSPELRRYQGDKVSVRVPKFEYWDKLPVYGDKGEFLGLAERQTEWGFTDQRGAIEAEQLSRENKQGINELRRQAPKIDLLEERRKLFEAPPPAPQLQPIAIITGSEKAQEIIAYSREPEEVRHEREQREEWENHRKFNELTDRILKNGTRG